VVRRRCRTSVAIERPQRIDLRSCREPLARFDATRSRRRARCCTGTRAIAHCGACGGEIAFVRARLARTLQRCGAEHYPTHRPGVIAAVTDGERLLLGRQAPWPARRYSVLAGFVEPGESLEQTVAREVFEESGVRVHACRYLASQPWPFPGSLMLGFMAQAHPDEPVVGDELEDARLVHARRSPCRLGARLEHSAG
jgi:NAD+ diphosphatase